MLMKNDFGALPITDSPANTNQADDRVGNARAEGTSSSDASGNPSATSFLSDRSYQTYIELIAERGFVDARTPECAYLLERCSYKHLSDYFRPVLESVDSPSVKMVHDVMVFDRRFQSAVLKYIGIVETQTRAQYAHWMQVFNGRFSLYNEELFLRKRNYEKALNTYLSEQDRALRNSRRFQRIASNNGDMLPIDSAVEIMSLGLLSKFFSNTADLDVTNRVANSFSVTKGDLSGWLRSIADSRNVFAHFGAYLPRKQIPTTPRKIEGHGAYNWKPSYIAYLVLFLIAENPPFHGQSLNYARLMKHEMESIIGDFEAVNPEILSKLGFRSQWREDFNLAMQLGIRATRKMPT